MNTSKRSRSKRRESPKSLGVILQDLAAAAGEERLEQVARELSIRRVLGPYLARRLVACRLDGGVLVLEMSDPGVAEEVRSLSAEVLRGLAKAGRDAPRYIRTTVAEQAVVRRAGLEPVHERPTVRETATDAPGPSALEALEQVSDPSMRRRLSRWMQRARTSSTSSDSP